MNTYIIEHEIIALLDNIYVDWSKAITNFSIDWIKFSHWDFTYWEWTFGEKWLARIEIKSYNYIDAQNIYYKKLLKIIPKISFIWQAYIDSHKGSLLIKKWNQGILRYIYNDNPVSLSFWKKEQTILKNLIKNKNIPESFYSYWNDLVNTQWYSWKILLLCSAVESLLPRKIERPKDLKEKINKKRFELRKNILWEELDKEIFQQNKWLRHRLIHWEYFLPEDFQKNYVEEIHKKVIEYFNKNIITIDEKITLEIFNPQRHLHANYKQWGIFLEFNKKISLKEILSEIENNNLNTLKSWKWISKPENF